MSVDTLSETDSRMTAHARCFHVLSLLTQFIMVLCCIFLLVEVIHMKREQNQFKLDIKALQHALEGDNFQSKQASFHSAGQSNARDPNLYNEMLDGRNGVGNGKRFSRSTGRGRCGGTIDIEPNSVRSYNLQSPGYPVAYPPSEDCVWHFVLSDLITVKPTLKLKFTGPINLEYEKTCAYDKLEVRKEGPTGPLIGSYCGKNMTLPDVEYSGSLYIRFKSDYMINEKGFRAQVAVKHQCGGTIYVDRLNESRTYDLQSPNHPSQYPTNALCEWYFVLAYPDPDLYRGKLTQVESSRTLNKVLRLHFLTALDLEPHRKCSYDIVEVRGGSSNGPLLASYCGVTPSIPDIVYDGPLYIKFKSDHAVSARGFKAQISGELFSQIYGKDSSSDTVGPDDVTFIHWGKENCSMGSPVYTGSIAGSSNLQSLSCIPLPDEESTNKTINSTYLVDSPELEHVQFNLQSQMLLSALNASETSVDSNNTNGAVSCSLCHTFRTEAFTVIGWDRCNASSHWMLAYNGYLVTSTSLNSSAISDPICMDHFPTYSPNNSSMTSSSIKLAFMSSGKDNQMEDNQPIKCAVCIAQAKPYYF